MLKEEVLKSKAASDRKLTKGILQGIMSEICWSLDGVCAWEARRPPFTRPSSPQLLPRLCATPTNGEGTWGMLPTKKSVPHGRWWGQPRTRQHLAPIKRWGTGTPLLPSGPPPPPSKRTTHRTHIPWTARRSNQSILREIIPEYSLEGLMLKLKFQSFGHLMGRTDSLEKTLVLGKIEGRRRRGWQRMRWLNGITDSMDMSLWCLGSSGSLWWTEKSGVLQSMGSQRVRPDWETELNWTDVWNQHNALRIYNLGKYSIFLRFLLDYFSGRIHFISKVIFNLNRG